MKKRFMMFTLLATAFSDLKRQEQEAGIESDFMQAEA
ncbi:hypothetical protein SDC9_167598 [bioreactor metagenome]|uniref:Uncharacterized protein n=1 Tax=bioreactor metagenome TaxID=1076179 RepID=A0A645G2U4_9ZZZZ